MLLALPAAADPMTDASVMIRAGQFNEALSKVDAALVQSPRDKQMRFLKGVILTELNKPNEAITVCTKLTEDFPELPEPYNNLAVLFAANGQYDKARAALEMAIRTNPTYATAHENLGDIYAKLASKAYDKALQLDSSNTTAKSKLTMIRTLVGGSEGKNAVATSAAVKAPATPVVVASKTPLPSSEQKVEPKVEPKIEPKSNEKVASKPSANDADRDEILAVVESWAKAWSAKDVAGYLSYYAASFQPANGQSHKAWMEDRRLRIEGKGSISVKIGTPQVSVEGNSATVKFRQQYVSNQIRSNAQKTLVLVKQSGKWQIKQERSGI